MTTEHSTYTYEGGVQETVRLRRSSITPRGHALLQVSYSDGRRADCYVNTAWLRDRLNDLGEPCPVPAAPRALTPDAITDEMVKRGEEAYREAGRYISFRSVHLILTAALTEPPARPEGADWFDPIVDAAIRGYSDITSPDVVRAISDAIAEEMNR